MNEDSAAIILHPYDPNLWLARAYTLNDLRYPELAVGDAHKSILLCKHILGSLQQKPRSRIGHNWGFYMLDLQLVDDPGQSNERDWQFDRIAQLNRQAHLILEENLHRGIGFYIPRSYPWMRSEHLSRSDELVDLLNLELSESGKFGLGEPACVVRQ